jgi:hypothetical protein
MSDLSRERILDALAELSRRLGERGIRGEVCLFGGAAMVLAFRARQSTRDIDAVFSPASEVREIAMQIGRERGYADGWFNDGVKGFLSGKHEVSVANLPQYEFLQVTMPVPEYLFAMKCMAARVGIGGGTDEADARLLTRHLGLTRADEALRIVAAYYPAERVPPRTQYFIEALFAAEEGKA